MPMKESHIQAGLPRKSAEMAARSASMESVTRLRCCVGCCWSLMLVMFGVGLGSVTAMLALGAVTAVEKNLPWGRRMTRPLGVLLLVAAVYSVASVG